MTDDADISYGPPLQDRMRQVCDCGATIRMKPYAPGKVAIPIMVPVNLDGSLHFCGDQMGCKRARFD